MMEEEVLSQKGYDGGLLRRLLAYAIPHWPLMGVALVMLLVNAAATVAGPLLTKLAVDRYLAPVAAREPHPLDTWLSAEPRMGLLEVALGVLLTLVIAAVASFIQNYCMQRTGQLAMLALRRNLVAHLNRLDMAYFDSQPVGRLVTRVTSDVDALNEMLASGTVAVVGDVVVVIFLFFSMLRLSPGMTALMLAVTPLVLVATLRFRTASQSSNRRVRAAVARINAFLQEHITGIAVVQLFNREQASRREFEDANRDHVLAYRDAIHAYGWFYPAVEFAGMLAVAGLMSYGGWRIRSGALSLGALVAFFQYGIRFFRPIQDLSEKYNIIQTSMAAAERVFHLLDTGAAIQAPAAPKPLPPGPAAIEFDHVWFAYKDEQWVIRDVSFRIEPGTTAAIVGHTGAGKTTLTSLLLRFYDVQRGSIRIGGVDIREMDPVALRRHFGVVLQDPFLFTGDLSENIRLGDTGIGDEQIREAAARVNLLDFVDTLPDRFAHPVRERGSGLSTGQKQLVSFARALAHQPRFLILDEATSSVDTETEVRIREALRTLLEGRTSIVIAHRLSTVQRADQVLVMHKAELRESGTHQQLLAQRGLYWKLYRLQYQDQERAPVPAAPAPMIEDRA